MITCLTSIFTRFLSFIQVYFLTVSFCPVFGCFTLPQSLTDKVTFSILLSMPTLIILFIIYKKKKLNFCFICLRQKKVASPSETMSHQLDTEQKLKSTIAQRAIINVFILRWLHFIYFIIYLCVFFYGTYSIIVRDLN